MDEVMDGLTITDDFTRHSTTSVDAVREKLARGTVERTPHDEPVKRYGIQRQGQGLQNRDHIMPLEKVL